MLRSALLTALAVGGWAAYQKISPLIIVKNNNSPTKRSWQIITSSPDQLALSQDQLAKIRQKIASTIGPASPADLVRVAANIHHDIDFARVSLVKSRPGTLHLVLYRAQPVARIEMPKSSQTPVRLVSANGKVFGLAREPELALPIINLGVENSGITSLKNDDHTLAVSEKTQSLILEALELLRSGSDHRFHSQKIRFIPHRGFEVSISHQQRVVEVVMGRQPFQARWKKLKKLLSSSDKRGRIVQRIELDYRGKAFITETKL